MLPAEEEGYSDFEKSMIQFKLSAKQKISKMKKKILAMQSGLESTSKDDQEKIDSIHSMLKTDLAKTTAIHERIDAD